MDDMDDMDAMVKNFLKKEKKLAVIGLGYVGLPLALSFAKHLKVIGYDIDKNKLKQLAKGFDPTGESAPSDFENTDIEFTSSIKKLAEASFFIVTVLTPVDKNNKPDLTPLDSAVQTIANVIKKDDYVVFESTVYPGCTEEHCIPMIEKLSGLKTCVDFKYGYSPERINPGDKTHKIDNTTKIVSGCDDESLEVIKELYNIIIKKGVYPAKSVKVAEAAKIIENTQRDVNIALMNELSIIFNRLGINTYDVLDAAETKWNFLKFYPGLVGGHCIGVDPYYLEYKAAELKYPTRLIKAGRNINDSMGGYIAKKLVKDLISNKKDLRDSQILIMGVTFKENVTDIRNSKVVDIVRELNDHGVKVDIMDPCANKKQVYKEYGLNLIEKPHSKYNAVIVAVAHDQYQNLDENYFKKITQKGAILADIKGIYKNKISSMPYWTL